MSEPAQIAQKLHQLAEAEAQQADAAQQLRKLCAAACDALQGRVARPDPHASASHSPGTRPRRVRTAVVLSSCPVCGQALQGRRLVCSPRCRARRWRQGRARQAEQAQARDQELRALLEAALTKLGEG